MEGIISNSNLFNSIAIVATLIFGLFLIRKKVINSELWGATVTPLASIIGSGFLIVAPLLHSVFGKWAPMGIIVLLVLAYGIGLVIRFNILHAESLEFSSHPFNLRLEKLSQIVLGIAYAISVAFYISLFTSFISREFGIDNTQTMKWITTATLLSVM